MRSEKHGSFESAYKQYGADMQVQIGEVNAGTGIMHSLAMRE